MDADAGSTGAGSTLVQRHDGDGDRLVVHLHGELDLVSRDVLTRELDHVLDDAAGRVLCIDMGKVTFLDAAALGVLARAGSRGRELRSTVVVVNVQPFHRRIFEIAPCASLVVEG